MTATDPITPPVVDEHAERAKVLLGDAAHEERFYSPYMDDSQRVLQKLDTGTAQYAAQAATAHALLSVRDELADIAGSLHQLAAIPAAVQRLGDSVTAVKDEMAEVAAEVLGCNQATTLGAMDVAAAIREAGEILEDRLTAIEEALSRPRWWQWRQRREIRRQQAAIAEAVTTSQADPWEVTA